MQKILQLIRNFVVNLFHQLTQLVIPPHIEIIGEWKDDLIWCPSQCYLKFIFDSQKYVIYLRWRWVDPWQATLIKCKKDFELHGDSTWIQLFGQRDYFTDKQLPECKKYALKLAKQYIGVASNPYYNAD